MKGIFEHYVDQVNVEISSWCKGSCNVTIVLTLAPRYEDERRNGGRPIVAPCIVTLVLDEDHRRFSLRSLPVSVEETATDAVTLSSLSMSWFDFRLSSSLSSHYTEWAIMIR
jgi:hypothetical protein